jgi:hypothetical protein
MMEISIMGAAEIISAHGGKELLPPQEAATTRQRLSGTTSGLQRVYQLP